MLLLNLEHILQSGRVALKFQATEISCNTQSQCTFSILTHDSANGNIDTFLCCVSVALLAVSCVQVLYIYIYVYVGNY
jgi:hypothetical protein